MFKTFKTTIVLPNNYVAIVHNLSLCNLTTLVPWFCHIIINHSLFSLHEISLYSYLQKLPTDVFNALDLEQVFPSQNTNIVPVSPIHINGRGTNRSDCQSALHYEVHAVALELVKNALLSACRRLSINGDRCDVSFRTNQQDLRMGSKCFSRGRVGEYDWTVTKRGSPVSMESEGYVSGSSGFNTSRNVSFQDQSSSTVEIADEEFEREIRIVAKKLVNKVLHIACKDVESLYRRSSIEYLIASTKRMKITESPSPPPTLFNIVEEQGDEQATKHTFKFSQAPRGKTERSPTPEGHRTRRLGSKRKRSGSHDVAMQDDRDQKKQLSLGNQFSDEKQRVTKEVTRRHVQRESEEQNSSMLSTSDNELFGVADLTTTIDRLSLVVDSESDVEENYTVLSAVTKPTSSEFTEASREHEQAHQFGQFAMQESESKTFPTGPPQNFDESSFMFTNSKMAEVPSIVLNDAFDPNCDVILDIDLFVIIHSHPPPSLCQKILCSNLDEVNLVYHCWLYKDSPFDPSVTLSSKLEMGVFDPHLVQPVHLELQDGGAPFYFLDERYVHPQV